LRVRETESPEAFSNHLRQAFIRLYDIFGAGYFEVSVTANVVLEGTRNGQFAVFYGQDFGDGDYSFAPDTVVRNLGQVGNLPINFTAQDFGRVFAANHEATDVSVHSIISIVYLIRRHLDNYERDRTGLGQTLQRLY
jgi:hypothetical protein